MDTVRALAMEDLRKADALRLAEMRKNHKVRLVRSIYCCGEEDMIYDVYVDNHHWGTYENGILKEGVQ